MKSENDAYLILKQICDLMHDIETLKSRIFEDRQEIEKKKEEVEGLREEVDTFDYAREEEQRNAERKNEGKSGQPRP